MFGPSVALHRIAERLGLRLRQTLPDPTALPRDISAAIESNGHAPFLVIRIPRCHDIPRVLICPTHKDLEAFEEQLSAFVELRAESRLLQALGYVLQGETYRAGFAFWDWVHAPAGLDETTQVYFECKLGPPPKSHAYYPIFDFCGGKTTRLERGIMLEGMFDAFQQIAGNEPQRFEFVLGLALAVIRHCGTTGEYAAGLAYLDQIERSETRYLHFDACRRALELRQHGHPVPPHLAKFVGPDSGYLNRVTCRVPFSEFSVVSGGEVFICCGHLVPLSIGNLEQDEVAPIWNSNKARKIRGAVTDGTFRYCNHLGCAALTRGLLPQKSSPEIQNDAVMRAAVQQGKTEVEAIRWLYFGYDTSCNLSCPSCRREVLMEKQSVGVSKRKAIEEKIKPILPQIDRLFMNSCCEFLVSKPSRKLLQSIDPKVCPELKIDLISNGTLFSEAEWAKFANIHSQVRSIRISMDSARPATFEAVRRGGRWPIFFDNIKFIARMRFERRIESLTFSFAYQFANFREMPEFILLCEELRVDWATFEHLVKTEAMTDAEYAERAVHELRHPLYQEFQMLVKNPNFRRPMVVCDFPV